MGTFNTEKTTRDRYCRRSVNWGAIQVNPADLVEAYRELFTARLVMHTSDTTHSRTTALAHGQEAVAGLLANGYKKGEVAVILSILASEG